MYSRPVLCDLVLGTVDIPHVIIISSLYDRSRFVARYSYNALKISNRSEVRTTKHPKITLAE